MSEEEKEVLKTFKSGLGLTGAEQEILVNYIDKLQKEKEYEKELRIRYERRYDLCKESKDKLQKEIEKYKRLAKANLKDSQEFQDNMCNHRCIKNNEVLELKAEIEKKDKVIDLMAEELERYGIGSAERYKEYFYRKAEEENE